MEGMVMSEVTNPNISFWNGKRVLITGHTGFKGGWLSLWLQKMGANLSGLALEPPTSPSLFNVASVKDGMEHQIVDIRDYNALNEYIAKFNPEIIFHMAAQPLVRYSYKNPIETYATNVMGTVHVLEAARKSGSVKAIVNVTTDKCYENNEWHWGYRENERMGGDDPYASSKGCVELLSNAYQRSFFEYENIAMATARAGNVIGGGDWAKDRLVPEILNSIEKNKSILIRNPKSIRPWQHVLECLSGYLILAENLFNHKQAYSEGWNFGPNDQDAKPVYWIADKLIELCDSNIFWELDKKHQLHEASFLKLDNSKSLHRLNWRPRLTLEEALLFIVDWHDSWQSNDDMKLKCFNQIDNFNKIS
jgi:CDP-glucose 4,6-dehydratase